MAFVAAFAAVAGAGASVYGAVQSSKAQRRAARAQQQQQAVQTRRSRREAIRRNQIARAQAIASAQSAGGLGGSGTAGGIGSLSSRTGSALGFSSQMGALSGVIPNASADMAQAQGIAGLGSTLFQTGLSFGAFQPQEPNTASATRSPVDIAGIGRGGLY